MTHHSVAQPKTDAPPAHVPEAFFAPSLFQTLFWKPRFLPEAPTVAHLPFLFWLSVVFTPQRVAVLGCDDGAAHFALCQALDKLGSEAQCHGYGFWSDAKSGAPLASPPEALLQHEAMLYDGLSRLSPCPSLDEALESLGEDAIDLLFVDLDALPETAHVAGESLASCLDSPGVMLLHGTNELSRRATDGRALKRFIESRRHVEFTAGSGMVLIVNGDELPAPLQSLLDCTRKGALRSDIELVYRRSGQGLRHSAQAAALSDQLEKNRKALTTTRRELDAAQREGESLRESQALHKMKLADLQVELFDLQTEVDRLNKALGLEKEKEREAGVLRARLAEAEDARDAAEAERDNARKTLDIQSKEAGELRARLADAEAARATERTARFEDTAALTRIAEEMRGKITAIEGRQKILQRENAALQARIDELLVSTSWRVTAPMRSIKQTFGRKPG